ncbi:hypothetical protein [Streptomyces albidoflavus]|uniref:hypothetical protein n=1 Tax=Streptomyces albidoflavus TaxID=1886 RepID=UPI004041E01D
MATKKKTASAPAPVACGECHGSGVVPVTVRVGRGRRVAGQQDGVCLACLGTGQSEG